MATHDVLLLAAFVVAVVSSAGAVVAAALMASPAAALAERVSRCANVASAANSSWPSSTRLCSSKCTLAMNAVVVVLVVVSSSRRWPLLLPGCL